MPSIDELIEEEEQKKRKHVVSGKSHSYSFQSKRGKSTDFLDLKKFLVPGIVVCVIGVVLFLILNTKPEGNLQENEVTSAPTGVVMIPFDYTVSSIDSSQIVLNGEKGNVTLPNDATIVTVYTGGIVKREQASITDLKVGQKVKLETLPGKSAKLFIL